MASNTQPKRFTRWFAFTGTLPDEAIYQVYYGRWTTDLPPGDDAYNMVIEQITAFYCRETNATLGRWTAVTVVEVFPRHVPEHLLGEGIEAFVLDQYFFCMGNFDAPFLSEGELLNEDKEAKFHSSDGAFPSKWHVDVEDDEDLPF